MLKTYHKELAFLQKITDVFVVLFSWLLAYYMRFEYFHVEHYWYAKYSILLVFIHYYFFKKLGLYKSQRDKHAVVEIFSTLKANLVVVCLFVLSLYFFSPEKISRAVLINYSIYSTLLLIIEKSFIRTFLRRSRANGKNLRHVILFGDGQQAEDYLRVIRSDPGIGIHVTGWIESNGLCEKYGIPHLKLQSVIDFKKSGVDYLVLGYPMKDFGRVVEILNEVSGDLINLMVLPDLGYTLIGHQISDFSGLPVININQPGFSANSIFAKRVFDFVLSSLGLIIISPILFFISIGVKLSSPGPVFFGQRRVGLDGREFLMWKFRSMKVDSESSGSGWTTKNDPRRTRFGTFIRSTSIDELPQLWNVFIGDMSLVGPRPEQPYFVDKFKQEIPSYMLRHKVMVGVTGWAQVNGWRGDTSIPARIECDIWYIKNWSLWLDIEILFMTVWKGFKNAY